MKQRLINRWMDLYPLRGMMAMLVFEKERTDFKRIESILFFRYGYDISLTHKL